jgi:hypothetical protein
MEELVIINAGLIKDRNVLKARLTVRKNDKFFGFIKPLKYFV